MSDYIKLTNGEPEIYTISQLRRDNPNVSFPKNIPDDILQKYDVFPFTEEPMPDTAPGTRAVKDALPTQDDIGNWVMRWSIVDIPLEEKAVTIRRKRDKLLAQSDWTQVADAPVDQTAWATYRQTLRDIPQQVEFPNNVNWPNEPTVGE